MKRYYKLSAVHILTAIVCFVILSLNTSACQAANWQWCWSTDTETVEIDTSSVHYSNFSYVGRNLVFWFRYINLDKSSTTGQAAARNKDGIDQIAFITAVGYDKDGKTIFSEDVSNDQYKFKYESIIPGSNGERIYNIAKKYAK